jgi:hypothetical protein
MRRIGVQNKRGGKLQYIDLDAISGAELGVNLYYNGELLDPRLILNSYVPSAQAAAGGSPGGGDLTTDDVYEASRLYFTRERAQDAAAALFSTGANLTFTYFDDTNTAAFDLTETGIAAGTYAGITFDVYGRALDAVPFHATNEILVADGVSAPPVMLTNEAEDDFLYGD